MATPGAASNGWLTLTDACVRSGCSQNQLYRLAAVGKVRTRRRNGGPLEFLAKDLETVREQGAGAELLPASGA